MGVITGLDQITYGVEDLNEGKRFFTDWGLRLVCEEEDRLLFETLELSQIEIKLIDDPGLPPAIEDGSTVREVIWGVNTQTGLDDLSGKIRDKRGVVKGEDGIIRCVDPSGLTIGFRTTTRRPTHIVGSPTNCYGKISRINQPSKLYQRAEPVRLSHIVWFTDKIDQLVTFYRDVLEFYVSDSYPGEGIFLRCQEQGGHHDLFLLHNPEVKPRGLNHVSFMVRDIYEVFGGGIHMDRLGWETQIGPGRHPISSAIFWYVKCPCGALTEYYADEDYLTKDWVPREFQRSIENFAEWSITGGIDSSTRKQKI